MWPVMAVPQKCQTRKSVASFFVSRVDTEADRRLEELGRTDLQGKLAVANAKLAYRNYERVFSGDRWDALVEKVSDLATTVKSTQQRLQQNLATNIDHKAVQTGLLSDFDQLVRASRLYYELGETQEQVAERLGVTRAHVSKLLKRARAAGVVIRVPVALGRVERTQVEPCDERHGEHRRRVQDDQIVLLGSLGQEILHFPAQDQFEVVAVRVRAAVRQRGGDSRRSAPASAPPSIRARASGWARSRSKRAT